MLRSIPPGLLMLLTACSAAGAVGGPPDFAEPTELIGSGGTAGSAAADLDGDGRDEFITQEHFAILDLDAGTWSLERPLADINDRLDRFGGDIEVGDIDRDGWIDIVLTDTSNSGTTGELLWFENPDGDLAGTWTEHLVSSWSGNGTGDEITHAEEEVGDLDGDGDLDIVVRDIQHGVWIHLNQGDGTWAPRRFVATNPREGLELWNPDGDGDLDLLLNGVWIETPADPSAGDFTIHAIPGMGDWYPDGSSGDEISDYACKVLARDLDGDGRLDVVISNAEELDGQSPTKPHGIRAYLQPAAGLFEPWSEVIIEPDHISWHTLEVEDLDGDGDFDVLAAISDVGVGGASGDSSYWINDGAANWTEAPIDTLLGYQGVVGDSDGDGDPDLLLPAAFSEGPIRHYENVSATVPPDAYELYIDSFDLGGGDPAFAADPDRDGLANGIEFVLATDPGEFTPPGLRPQLSVGTDSMTFEFRRADASLEFDPGVEISDDLASFETVVDGVDGVEVVVHDDDIAAGVDRVEVTLPLPAGESSRLFFRLSIQRE